MFKRRQRQATGTITLSVERSGGRVSKLKYVGGQVPKDGSRLKVYRVERDKTSYKIFVGINNAEAVFQAEPLNDDTYRVGEMMSLQNTERVPLNTA